jgi:hypothetical protein
MAARVVLFSRYISRNLRLISLMAFGSSVLGIGRSIIVSIVSRNGTAIIFEK